MNRILGVTFIAVSVAASNPAWAAGAFKKMSFGLNGGATVENSAITPQGGLEFNYRFVPIFSVGVFLSAYPNTVSSFTASGGITSSNSFASYEGADFSYYPLAGGLSLGFRVGYNTIFYSTLSIQIAYQFIAPHLGYDFLIGQRVSLGLQGIAYYVLNTTDSLRPGAIATIKFWFL